jgi:hypothetical protein
MTPITPSGYTDQAYHNHQDPNSSQGPRRAENDASKVFRDADPLLPLAAETNIFDRSFRVVKNFITPITRAVAELNNYTVRVMNEYKSSPKILIFFGACLLSGNSLMMTVVSGGLGYILKDRVKKFEEDYKSAELKGFIDGLNSDRKLLLTLAVVGTAVAGYFVLSSAISKVMCTFLTSSVAVFAAGSLANDYSFDRRQKGLV